MMPSLSPEKLLTLSQKYKWQIIFVLVGILLVGAGIIFSKINSSEKVEVLGTETNSQNLNGSEIVVEISGEVEVPGVYSLSGGSRVNDLLISAGGLSENADRVWVEKNINKAAKLVDGQKVYIPKLSEKSTANGGQGAEFSPEGGLVNINSASQKELESLTGIGPAYAANIIEHRPYSKTEEIVSKAGVLQKTFEKIKGEITVY